MVIPLPEFLNFVLLKWKTTLVANSQGWACFGPSTQEVDCICPHKVTYRAAVRGLNASTGRAPIPFLEAPNVAFGHQRFQWKIQVQDPLDKSAFDPQRPQTMTSGVLGQHEFFFGGLGLPVVPFYPFLAEGSPTKLDCRKKGHLYSILSTGGPSRGTPCPLG